MADALDEGLVTFLERLDVALQPLLRTAVGNESAVAPREARQRAAKPPADDHWAVFQASLRIVQMYGDVLLRLRALAARLETDEGVFPRALRGCMSANRAAQQFATDVAFAPVRLSLAGVEQLPIWARDEPAAGASALPMPAFSRSPSRYITTIGEHLLVLPQQLEPFTDAANDALLCALRAGPAVAEGLAGGRGGADRPAEPTASSTPADIWLAGQCRRAVAAVVDVVLRIATLSESGRAQLLADLDYFVNVLRALEVDAGPRLTALQRLLSIEPASFAAAAAELQPAILSEAACRRIAHWRSLAPAV